MLFRKRKLKKHTEALGWHVQMIGKLEASRDDYERDGLEAMVLAANYEIMSHASRALAELRRTEELGGGDVKGAEMREYLTPKVDLPALRRDEIDSTPEARIRELYDQFAASDRGKSASQIAYDMNRQGL